MIPTSILRDTRVGFGLRRGTVRLLSTRFGKVCLAHHTPDGARAQLRLVKERAETADRLHAEMAWLRYLSGTHSLAVPRPMPWRTGGFVSPSLHANDGSAWRAVACSWIAGRHLDHGMRSRDMRAAGALLGTLHKATDGAPIGIAESRPVWWIPRLFELATTLRDLVHDDIEPPFGLPSSVAIGLRESHAALTRAHAGLPRGAEYEGVIHADAHSHNLRFTQQRVGLVDFEDFARGRFMLDVASTWDRFETRRDGAQLLDALLDGYASTRALPTGYMRDLHVMLAFRRFDYAGWILSWPRLDLQPWGPSFLAGTASCIARRLSD